MPNDPSTDLAEIINYDQPFGPSASEEIGQHYYLTIFDENNSVYNELRNRPSLIVGRRGAGKTALLSSHKLRTKYQVVVDIPPKAVFSQVLKEITANSEREILVEEIASVWIKILWTTLFAEISKKHLKSHPKQTAIITKYIDSIGVKGPNIYAIVRLIAKLLKKSRDAGQSVIEEVDRILTPEFDAAKRACVTVLKEKKQKAIILLDNLEEIKLGDEAVALAMRGLLKALGNFREPGNPCDVRCCIPSELYPSLMRISSNAEKDFSSKIILHWKSNELLHLAAVRFRLFLQTYGESAIYGKFQHFDLKEKNQIVRFYNEFFPKTIRNLKGIEESTLRYILRHTQLLPRQFIGYLNSIGQKSVNKQNNNRFIISEDEIKQGIVDYEHNVCEGIFSGFRTTYPEARKICNVLLPNIKSTFKLGDIQKLHRKISGNLPYFDDHQDLLSTLIEIGVVGVVEDEDENYIHGQFAYNMPHDLRYNVDDSFCVHPVFVREYRVQHPNNNGHRPTFPRGADIETD